jgi:hypothetical protein
MGDEFYAIIKLISGEEIFSSVCIDENDGDPIIILHHPVIMKSIQGPGISLIKVKPWLELSDDDILVIKLDRIITMTETKSKKIIEIYEKYLTEDNSVETYSPTGKVGVSTDMGYVSSVEDARQKLERIFKGLKES